MMVTPPSETAATKREVRACNVKRDTKALHIVALKDNEGPSPSEDEVSTTPKNQLALTKSEKKKKKKKLLKEDTAELVAINLIDMYVPLLIDTEKANSLETVFNLLHERFLGMSVEILVLANDRLVDIKAAHEPLRVAANKRFLASFLGERRFAAELSIKTPYDEYEVATKTLPQLLLAYQTRCFHLEITITKRQREPEVNVYYHLLDVLSPKPVIPVELFSSKDF
jgi:hypothetical protein